MRAATPLIALALALPAAAEEGPETVAGPLEPVSGITAYVTSEGLQLELGDEIVFRDGSALLRYEDGTFDYVEGWAAPADNPLARGSIEGALGRHWLEAETDAKRLAARKVITSLGYDVTAAPEEARQAASAAVVCTNMGNGPDSWEKPIAPALTACAQRAAKGLLISPR